MKKFRFIHTSDIHIGSIPHINNKSGIDLGYNYNNAVYDSFEIIINDAVKYNVDFIIIAGDIFDINCRSIKANKFFIDMCNKLYKNNIKLFIICGNHDWMMDYKEIFNLPANVIVFPQEKPYIYEFYKENILLTRIIGQSYKTRNDGRSIWKDYDVPNDGIFNIGMLHTSLDNDNRYIPCNINDLKNKNSINYWALGHIHKRSLAKEGNRLFVYPGIPQGRDFKESGSGGYYMVDVENNIPFIKFMPASVIEYINIDINIENEEINNISELENLIINKAVQISMDNGDEISKKVIRWIIKGRTKMHELLSIQNADDIEELINKINNDLNWQGINMYTDSIIIRTEKYIPNIDELKAKNKIFVEIKNVINEYINNEELKRELIQNMGKIYDPNYDYENVNYEKLPLDDEMVNEIIRQAESLIYEKLFDELI